MIYHWCPASDWEASGEAYSAPSLGEEGFIHFSYRNQVEKTATAIDRGRDDLLLLCVDPSNLDVVDEDCYESGEKFPHVYAPIPVASVVAFVQFPPEPDGSFRFPRAAPV